MLQNSNLTLNASTAAADCPRPYLQHGNHRSENLQFESSAAIQGTTWACASVERNVTSVGSGAD